eukprot:scaffold51699_cov39-Prasinocladus_malaysianus.AAC.2
MESRTLLAEALFAAFVHHRWCLLVAVAYLVPAIHAFVWIKHLTAAIHEAANEFEIPGLLECTLGGSVAPPAQVVELQTGSAAPLDSVEARDGVEASAPLAISAGLVVYQHLLGNLICRGKMSADLIRVMMI